MHRRNANTGMAHRHRSHAALPFYQPVHDGLQECNRNPGFPATKLEHNTHHRTMLTHNQRCNHDRNPTVPVTHRMMLTYTQRCNHDRTPTVPVTHCMMLTHPPTVTVPVNLTRNPSHDATTPTKYPGPSD